MWGRGREAKKRKKKEGGEEKKKEKVQKGRGEVLQVLSRGGRALVRFPMIHRNSPSHRMITRHYSPASKERERERSH